MRELAVAAVLLVVSLLLVWRSTIISNPGFDVLGPGFLPTLISIVLVVLTGSHVISSALKLRQPQAHTEPRDAEIRRGGADQSVMSRPLFKQSVLLVLLAAYIWALNLRFLPFEAVTPVFLIGTGLLFTGRDRKQAISLVVVSLILSFAVGYVFKSVLYVNLP